MDFIVMDNTTLLLIVSQAVTFLLLVFSEILPFTDSPHNGVLQVVIDALQKIVLLFQKKKELEMKEEPSIVKNE